MSYRARDEGSSRGPSRSRDESSRKPPPHAIEKMPSKALREIARGHHIRCTESLVKAYNAVKTAAEKDALFAWLKRYHEVFAISYAQEGANTVLEYAELTKIQPDTRLDEDTLVKLVGTLRGYIAHDDFVEKNLAKAIRIALSNIESRVFGEDPRQLRGLFETLLANLELCLNYTKPKFANHAATLFALCQAFGILREVAPDDVSVSDNERIQDTFQLRLNVMRDSEHYIFRLYTELIDRCVQRIAENKTQLNFVNSFQQLVADMTGMLYVYHGNEALSFENVSLAAVEREVTAFEAVVAAQDRDESRWYEWLQALNDAGFLILQDPEKFEIFKRCFGAAMKLQCEVKREESRKALRFGIVNELCQLAVHSRAAVIRKYAMVETIVLGTCLTLSEDWTADADVFEALLEAMALIYARGEHRAATAAAIEMMTSFSHPDLKQTITAWVGDEPVAERFTGHCDRTLSEESEGLFETVGTLVGLPQTSGEIKENGEDLRKGYQYDAFVQATVLSYAEKERHVKDLKFNIVIHEEVGERECYEVGKGGHEEAKIREAPGAKVRRSIPLEALFNSDTSRAKASPMEVRKVILTGNPGTGKTCISKAIAYKWATKTAWTELDAVYVLPIQRLTESNYKGYELRTEKNLETAIANICFSERTDTDFEILRTQIRTNLNQKTTMVIFDGLNEATEIGRQMVFAAKQLQCKLLLLGRREDLVQERTFVDVEAEVLGLNDLQLMEFIESELPEPKGGDLIQFLKGDLHTREIAYVPFHAFMLCRIWAERAAALKKKEIILSVSRLFREMTHFAWTEYRKLSVFDIHTRDEMYLAIEAIAFDSIKEHQIFVEDAIVTKHKGTFNKKNTFDKEIFQVFRRKEDKKFHFPHLTFQEYFAGMHLARSLSKSGSEERTAAIALITERKYLDSFQNILSFMTEEICGKQDYAGLKLVLSVIDQGSNEVIGFRQLFLSLRSIDSYLSTKTESSSGRFDRKAEIESLVDATVSMLTRLEYHSSLTRRVLDELRQLPNLLRCFPRITRALSRRMEEDHTHSTKIDELLGLAKQAPEHMEELVETMIRQSEEAYENVRVKTIERIAHTIGEAPFSAEALVDAIIRGSQDESALVRSVATKQFPLILPYIPQRSEDILKILEKRTEDKEQEVRKTAMMQVARTISEFPDKFVIFVSKLMASIDDPYPGVRVAAMHQIVDVLAKNTRKFDIYVDLLLKGTRDKETSVREAAMQHVAKAISHAPQRGETLSRVLVNGVEDSDWRVRIAALQQIPTLLPIRQRHTETLLGMLANGVYDENSQVRAAALNEIPKALSATPKGTDVLMSMLETCCEDLDSDVRIKTVQQTAKALFIAPKSADRLLSVLLKGAEDFGGDVRAAMIQQLTNAVVALPKKSPVLLEYMEKGTKDADRRVRAAVVKQAVGVANLFPACAEPIMGVLVKGCADDHALVRAAAMEEIGNALIFFPGKAEEFQNLLQAGTEDGSKEVQTAARSTLEKLPLDNLLNMTSKGETNDAVVHAIAQRLLDIAVTVESASLKDGRSRVVVHTKTASSSHWDQGQEEVREWMALVEADLAEEYPNLFEILKPARKNTPWLSRVFNFLK